MLDDELPCERPEKLEAMFLAKSYGYGIFAAALVVD